MSPKSTSVGDGFAREALPLVKDGFVILRSILDVMIDRIEEAERGREDNTRKEIYSSIIDALEAEVENIEKDGDDDISRSKIEALETVISVLMKESEELEAAARKKEKRSKRPRKVKID
jgi:hypothetical protein